MEKGSAHEATRPIMKTALVVEGLCALGFPAVLLFIHLSFRFRIFENDWSSPVFILFVAGAFSLIYIPMFFFNLVNYRKVHHRGVTTRAAWRIYAFHLVYGVLNLMAFNLILAPLYIASFAKGNGIIESRSEVDYQAS